MIDQYSYYVYTGDIAEKTRELQNALRGLENRPILSVGDIVRWKAGLRNANMAYGEPMIVTSIISPPRKRSDEKSSSSLYAEIIDVFIGMIDGELFTEFAMDSRRLELHTGKLTDYEKDLIAHGEPLSGAESPVNKRLREELMSKINNNDIGETVDQ